MNPQYKNILLINPWYGDVFPPPSLGYLQGAIKAYFKDEVNVTAANFPEVEELIKINSYDLVCVTYHSISVKSAVYIRNLIKTKLVCGGHHPSALPNQMLGIGYDQVVVGQGENAIIDIILGEESKIYSETKKYFETINDIPFPDYTGLEVNGEWGYPIITSRGCNNKCNFCASTDFWGNKWMSRSADSVVNEIKHVLDLGAKLWFFEDDNFTLNKRRAKEICQKIIDEVIPVYGRIGWQCGSRVESLVDVELCQLLKLAGCYCVWTGVETLSQDSLDRCEKGTTVEKMINGAKTASENGMDVVYQFILGLPGDTENDIRITSEQLKNSHMHRIATNFAWILPNTKIYNEAKKRGFNDNTYLNGGDLTYIYEQPMETLIKWKSML